MNITRYILNKTSRPQKSILALAQSGCRGRSCHEQEPETHRGEMRFIRIEKPRSSLDSRGIGRFGHFVRIGSVGLYAGGV